MYSRRLKIFDFGDGCERVHASQIPTMDFEELKGYAGFIEKPEELRLFASFTKNERFHVYVDNLISKL
jgi:hypothetical protein